MTQHVRESLYKSLTSSMAVNSYIVKYDHKTALREFYGSITPSDASFDKFVLESICVNAMTGTVTNVDIIKRWHNTYKFITERYAKQYSTVPKYLLAIIIKYWKVPVTTYSGGWRHPQSPYLEHQYESYTTWMWDNSIFGKGWTGHNIPELDIKWKIKNAFDVSDRKLVNDNGNEIVAIIKHGNGWWGSTVYCDEEKAHQKGWTILWSKEKEEEYAKMPKVILGK